MRLLALVGGAPRGECDGSVSSKAKASPQGRGSYRRKRQSAARAVFFVGAATPRRKRWFCQLGSQSFAPRAGLLQKSQSAARAASVGAAPCGECEGSACSKGKSFAPRSGLLQKSQSAARAVFCGRRAPRRMRRFCLLKRQKLRPEVGAPTEERAKAPPALLLWEPRPAANAKVLPAQKAKASPRGRVSYRRAKAQPASFFVGGATRGECDGSVSSKAKASPRGRASYRRAKAPPASFFVGGAPRGESDSSVSSKAKASPRGRASYRRAKAPPASLCGSRAPRRMRRFCLLKSQASPRGRGSYIPTASAGVVSSTAPAQPSDVPPIACPESASAALALR